MTYDQLVAYCAPLQGLIDAGFAVNIHIEGVTLFSVDQVGVVDGHFFVSGYGAGYHYQTLELQFPLNYINVSLLSAASINHV